MKYVWVSKVKCGKVFNVHQSYRIKAGAFFKEDEVDAELFCSIYAVYII